MKQLLIIAFVLLLVSGLKSQQLRIDANAGIAIVEFPHSKRIVLSNAFNLGYEFISSSSTWQFVITPGILRLAYGFDDTSAANHFNQMIFLTLTPTIKKYSSISRRSSAFMEFGIYGAHLLTNKDQINSGGTLTENKINNAGYNFGLFTKFGFKTAFSSKLFVDIHLSGQKELANKYSNPLNKVSFNQIGLGFSIYRSL
ncbi:MAG: hypothetical protein H0U44_05720 [Flavisolibacter sp.]|jgi:hypothetical protein|nr:hypothetical protein [Flavisolibacter sp.]